MDVFSKSKRSEVMSKIRSRNTGPEKKLWGMLISGGVKFRKNYKGLPGSPDAYLYKKRIAIFVNGEFWHGRVKVRKFLRLPLYWKRKLVRNIIRDVKVNIKLRLIGIRPVTIWSRDNFRLRLIEAGVI